MKTRRSSPLHPLVAACALLVAACGGGTAATTSSSEPAAASAPVPATAPAPAEPDAQLSPAAWRGTLKVSYGGVDVDVVIDKPQGVAFDAFVVYHGSVARDDLILGAAHDTLDGFRALLDDASTMMMVSVVYPEENLLMGDNLPQAEAALLWVKHVAARQLGVRIRHVFLGGHSQGGYLVTRLNALHPTRGVIANAPGPLDLVYRCGQEEQGRLAASRHCTRLRAAYGSTSANPAAYASRSLRSFTSGYTSDILFVQGLEDSPIQMHGWPAFIAEVAACGDCRAVDVLEVPGAGHASLFNVTVARDRFRAFLQPRR